VYDYAARYTAGATTFPCPARLPAPVLAAAEAAALAVHRLLGLRDLSRTDAIVTDDGTVYVLEVNTCPGLTETSLLPTAMTAAGEHLGQLVSRLIDATIERASQSA
jgi:D-alanine-D-alanine ligase